MSSGSSSRSTASANKKLDEKNLKTLRELAALSFNKQCFDCHQRGPTYINMTIGSFVCTSCSGRLRGLNPPHRVKSISMATFTHDEIELIKSRGNEYCRKVWMGRHDKSRTIDETSFKDETQMKDFLVLKYEKKRWYVSPSEIPPEELSAQHTGGSTGSAGSGHVGAVQHANSNSHSSSAVANNFPAKSASAAAAVQQQHATASAVSAQSPTFSSSTVNKQNNLVSLLDGDPFGHPAPAPVAVASTNGSGFANFANFDAFSPPAHQQLPTNQQQAPQLRPLDSSSSMSKSATVPVMSAKPASGQQTATAASPPDSDKYSALKELDEIFSQPTSVPSHTSSGATGQQNQMPSWMPPSSGTAAAVSANSTFSGVVNPHSVGSLGMVVNAQQHQHQQHHVKTNMMTTSISAFNVGHNLGQGGLVAFNAGNPFFATPHQQPNQPTQWNVQQQQQQQPIANNPTQISANPFFAGTNVMSSATGGNPFGGVAPPGGQQQQPFGGMPYGAVTPQQQQQQAFMASQQQQWGAGANAAVSNPFAGGPQHQQQQAGWNPFFK